VALYRAKLATVRAFGELAANTTALPSAPVGHRVAVAKPSKCTTSRFVGARHVSQSIEEASMLIDISPPTQNLHRIETIMEEGHTGLLRPFPMRKPIGQRPLVTVAVLGPPEQCGALTIAPQPASTPVSPIRHWNRPTHGPKAAGGGRRMPRSRWLAVLRRGYGPKPIRLAKKHSGITNTPA